MANEYLLSKWKTWYKSLDVNHDGIISFADVEESRNKFTQLHHLEANQKKAAMESLEKWWGEFIFRGKPERQISEKEFLDILSNEFKTDKKKFIARMQKCMATIFEVIDTNKDRNISEEEFLVAFMAAGHENVALDKKFFQGYKPKNGMVPLGTIVDSWVHFVSSDDKSKPDVVKEAFDSGV